MDDSPTFPRRTDTPEILAAIDAGDYGEARRLRADRDAALIAEQPEDVRERRSAIVSAFNGFFEIADMLRSCPPPGGAPEDRRQSEDA